MSIYQAILGHDFHMLHPKLRKRYLITADKEFNGKGTMSEISGGNAFVRLLFKLALPYRCFYPERGENIPFSIVNRAIEAEDGTAGVLWNRTFSFGKKNRYFDAKMILDDEKDEIIDFFGQPPFFISTLEFSVESDGSLVITSDKQWLYVFKKRIPLPKMLYGYTLVKESYDDKNDCYLIEVHVDNPLFGTLFFYKGSFRELEESI
ncbi:MULTISPECIES: DUF4166 domain-containing protein [Bacillus]|uniref:DUF4166 domain-containing protein n=2 Tax=Bacillus TaxID=1386 RepID=A0A0M4FYL0_9BACI|nr:MULTISPECIES: DUF4166 domain-containing protein [Bacillus]ALC82463.1 hypothetical protein AM592_13365 [Bacillus gobiensis]MBP1081348.1 hypothetical protein [Bacillus capparidis]MED1096026.1 DUF4166 domain-containing protein [Bacillus capparidis]